MGAPDAATVADNPTDMPRNPRDMGTYGADIITGTGDQMPGESTTKHAHYGGANGLAKGSERYDKHTKTHESELMTRAAGGADVMPAPGEEGKSQEEVRAAKGL